MPLLGWEGVHTTNSNDPHPLFLLLLAAMTDGFNRSSVNNLATNTTLHFYEEFREL